MQPNLALFFVVMALFCAAAVALQEYILAVAEGCATLLLLGCYQWLSVRRRRALADYVQATSVGRRDAVPRGPRQAERQRARLV